MRAWRLFWPLERAQAEAAVRQEHQVSPAAAAVVADLALFRDSSSPRFFCLTLCFYMLLVGLMVARHRTVAQPVS